MTIPKNTHIECPGCGKGIAKTKREIVTGEIIKADDFYWTNRKYISGEEMRCAEPFCGVSWGEDGELHTPDGWMG